MAIHWDSDVSILFGSPPNLKRDITYSPIGNIAYLRKYIAPAPKTKNRFSIAAGPGYAWPSVDDSQSKSFGISDSELAAIKSIRRAVDVQGEVNGVGASVRVRKGHRMPGT
jgi:hypothetical protein